MAKQPQLPAGSWGSRPAVQIPKGKFSSTEEVAKEKPKRSLRLSANHLPANVETKLKMVAGKDKSSEQKVQTRGKESKGKTG